MPPSPMPIPSVNRALASTDEDEMNIDNFGVENFSTSTMRQEYNFYGLPGGNEGTQAT